MVHSTLLSPPRQLPQPESPIITRTSHFPIPSNREYRISLLPVCTAVCANVECWIRSYTDSNPSFHAFCYTTFFHYSGAGATPQMSEDQNCSGAATSYEVAAPEQCSHKLPRARAAGCPQIPNGTVATQDRTCPSSHRNPSSASSTHAKAEQQWSDSRSRKGGRRKEEGNSRGACYASSPHEMIINIRASPSTDVTLESSSMSTETKLSLGFTKEDSDRVGVIMEP